MLLFSASMICFVSQGVSELFRALGKLTWPVQTSRQITFGLHIRIRLRDEQTRTIVEAFPGISMGHQLLVVRTYVENQQPFCGFVIQAKT